MNKEVPVYRSLPAFISKDAFETGFNNGLFSAWFTEDEMKRFRINKNILSLACRYLLKKTIVEFCGCDNRFCGLEIMNDKNGKPVLHCSPELKTSLKDKGISQVFFSFTHSADLAAVLVVLEE